MTARAPRPRRLVAVLVLLAAALAAAGCGSGGIGREQQAQQDALQYEQQIGQINTAAAVPAVSAQDTRDRLAATVKRYAALHPPTFLRTLHRRILRALRDELRSVKGGLRATAAGDGAGIGRAQVANARSRAGVTRLLGQIAARIGRCRTSLPACVPASPSTGSG
ncbi:hypothetical protein NBH00_14665 [Paraconexibacter antarcticus]|uniref:Lipoprotein n=1 Tax=Paraconexibacter antarcticus TaxID=2949664 RepID=A0ABY5DLA6_9ACTN|nr:hypothetical protein [Paraconexibacter antarcticus]UTI62601.1 hypothetical protein NBH00_14665 [Paraconexibacter antarcticus]